MHESESSKIEGSYEEIGWLIGCPPEVVARCVIELQRTKTADVTLGNGFVTVLSRRMKRELNDREQTRLRVQKSRRNADVTPVSHDRVKSKSNKEEVKSKKEEKAEEDTPPSASPKRGTRLPDTFLLTSEMRSYAAEKRPDVDPVLETEKFCNHFRAAPGQKGVKLDWGLTWKNWILNARVTTALAQSNGTRKTEREKSADRTFNSISAIDELRRQGLAEQALSGGNNGSGSPDAILVESTGTH